MIRLLKNIQLFNKGDYMKRLLGIILINMGITLSLITDYHLPRLTDKQLYGIAAKSEANIYCGNILGSGFFIKEGTIVTNNHVIKMCKDKIAEIRTLYGTVKAKVVKTDSVQDLAMLEVIDKPQLFNPPSLKIADKEPDISDTVYNASNKGGLSYTFHKGEVQNFVRTKSGQELTITDLLFSFGSSGSAVINDKGEVVGVAVQINPTFFMSMHINLKTLKEFIK